MISCDGCFSIDYTIKSDLKSVLDLKQILSLSELVMLLKKAKRKKTAELNSKKCYYTYMWCFLKKSCSISG